MKHVLMLALLVLAGPVVQAVPLVYQGELLDGGRPANGIYDLRLTAHGDAVFGSALAEAITFEDVAVANGRFRVEGDFGAALAANTQAWIEVAVRDGASAGGFSTLGRREKATLAPLIGQCWSTTGDSGSSPATNFLGTTDAQPLVLRVQNQQAARYEPSSVLANGAPITANVIQGSAANFAGPDVRGATVAGGGVPIVEGGADPQVGVGAPNAVFDVYATVGGGSANVAGSNDGVNISSAFATVAGGIENVASGESSTVGGGNLNLASASRTTVCGGERNLASGVEAFVGGGQDNTAAGDSSVVAGGSNNCAGGNGSWAGGASAVVRSAQGNPQGCPFGAPDSGDANGDEGTFVWNDFSLGLPLRSTGPHQFLVRAAGGVVLQPTIDSEFDARKPRGAQLTVVTGSSGVDQNTTFNNTSAIFERAGANFVRLLAPSASERGVLFGDEINSAAAGVIYNGTQLQFRAGSNQLRMAVGTDGSLTLNSATAVKSGGGPWAAPSDARLKSHVQDLDGALDRLLQLRGVRFEYARPDAGVHPAGEHLGFIAQEVQAVFPDWVGRGSDGYLTVGPKGFEALAVEALRELDGRDALLQERHHAEIEQLTLENRRLHDLVQRLSRRLDALERRSR